PPRAQALGRAAGVVPPPGVGRPGEAGPARPPRLTVRILLALQPIEPVQSPLQLYGVRSGLGLDPRLRHSLGALDHAVGLRPVRRVRDPPPPPTPQPAGPHPRPPTAPAPRPTPVPPRRRPDRPHPAGPPGGASAGAPAAP